MESLSPRQQGQLGPRLFVRAWWQRCLRRKYYSTIKYDLYDNKREYSRGRFLEGSLKEEKGLVCDSDKNI